MVGGRSCAGCGSVFAPGPRERNPRKWCSERCRVGAARRRNPERRADYFRRTYIPAAGKPCANCGARMSDRPNFKYCSTVECKRRANRERVTASVQARRARLANVPAERFHSHEIFARDGWECGICRGPVDPAVRFPHPLSASLDHVVPLAAGGHHTRTNTRLTHLTCNRRKGGKHIPPPGGASTLEVTDGHTRTAA
jgi:5-methylcytosine-specific restriction endonuclease McrA